MLCGHRNFKKLKEKLVGVKNCEISLTQNENGDF